MDGTQITDYKQTEFNSSVACLIRIDGLMRTLHLADLNLIPDQNNRYLFCKSLKRLFKEGYTKFTPAEEKRCREYIKKLKEENVFSPALHKPFSESTLELIDEYEDYLIKCLDNHGMLMHTKDLRLPAARIG